MDKRQDCEVDRAEADVRTAEAEVQHALTDLEHAKGDLERAEAELVEAESHKHHLVEVTVDRVRKCVEAGVYVVSAFKAAVGVAADRELDILKGGMLQPLDDNAKISIRGGEVFVSHVRTGGSS